MKSTKKWAEEEDLQFQYSQGDMLDLPYDGDSVDCIMCRNVISHSDTTGVKKAISEIRRVLRENGECFLTLASKQTWGFKQEDWPLLDKNTRVRKRSLRSVNGGGLRIIDLKDKQEMKEKAAGWFHSKWGVPTDAYLECMENYLSGETEYGWYLCLDGEKIVAGLGVIENDFHDRKDLAPNVCAVYTEEEYRCRGIAGRLLDYVVSECKAKGIEPLYLVTDHSDFYERYGWEFLCMVQGDDEPEMTRMYIHR